MKSFELRGAIMDTESPPNPADAFMRETYVVVGTTRYPVVAVTVEGDDLVLHADEASGVGVSLTAFAQAIGSKPVS